MFISMLSTLGVRERTDKTDARGILLTTDLCEGVVSVPSLPPANLFVPSIALLEKTKPFIGLYHKNASSRLASGASTTTRAIP